MTVRVAVRRELAPDAPPRCPQRLCGAPVRARLARGLIPAGLAGMRRRRRSALHFDGARALPRLTVAPAARQSGADAVQALLVAHAAGIAERLRASGPDRHSGVSVHRTANTAVRTHS
eukprot:ctg_5202.g664